LFVGETGGENNSVCLAQRSIPNYRKDETKVRVYGHRGIVSCGLRVLMGSLSREHSVP
jgi:hypothetical protein